MGNNCCSDDTESTDLDYQNTNNRNNENTPNIARTGVNKTKIEQETDSQSVEILRGDNFNTLETRKDNNTNEGNKYDENRDEEYGVMENHTEGNNGQKEDLEGQDKDVGFQADPSIDGYVNATDQVPDSNEIPLEDFTTEILRDSETRVGSYDEYQAYYIDELKRNSDFQSLLNSNNNYTERMEDNDTFYSGYINTNGEKTIGFQLKRGGFKSQGYWLNNKLHYFGRVINEEGVVRQGFFSNGVLEGKGEENSPKYVYKGEFLNGVKHGDGEYDSPKEKYCGTYVDGKKHGQGTYNFKKEKHIYVGNFNKGSIEGQGVFTWGYGDSYNGSFLNNKPHGTGLYRWANGDIYEGEYIEGKKSGKGSMKWNDGKVYEGEFINNEPVKVTK